MQRGRRERALPSNAAEVAPTSPSASNTLGRKGSSAAEAAEGIWGEYDERELLAFKFSCDVDNRGRRALQEAARRLNIDDDRRHLPHGVVRLGRDDADDGFVAATPPPPPSMYGLSARAEQARRKFLLRKVEEQRAKIAEMDQTSRARKVARAEQWRSKRAEAARRRREQQKALAMEYAASAPRAPAAEPSANSVGAVAAGDGMGNGGGSIPAAAAPTAAEPTAPGAAAAAASTAPTTSAPAAQSRRRPLKRKKKVDKKGPGQAKGATAEAELLGIPVRSKLHLPSLQLAIAQVLGETPTPSMVAAANAEAPAIRAQQQAARHSQVKLAYRRARAGREQVRRTIEGHDGGSSIDYAGGDATAEETGVSPDGSVPVSQRYGLLRYFEPSLLESELGADDGLYDVGFGPTPPSGAQPQDEAPAPRRSRPARGGVIRFRKPRPPQRR